MDMETANRTRDAGLLAAIDAAGGVVRLSLALGRSRAAAAQWTRVPAERVLDVERITGIPRTTLRPDLYPSEAQ